MIFAGLVLLAVGAVDLVRQFLSTARRWIGYLVILAVILLLGGLGGAWPAMIAAPIAAILWVWTVPEEGESRSSFWPAVALAVISTLSVALLGDRDAAGAIGEVWQMRSPFGPVSYDLAVLVLGVIVFLLESGNLVVRAALAGEQSQKPDKGFKGGRLIGPLERIIVFLLTVTAAYTVLAAMLAAKGIVRFPEISKDGETGARAEYFLVGSLVSWVMALGGAFLVWWAAHV